MCDPTPPPHFALLSFSLFSSSEDARHACLGNVIIRRAWLWGARVGVWAYLLISAASGMTLETARGAGSGLLQALVLPPSLAGAEDADGRGVAWLLVAGYKHTLYGTFVVSYMKPFY